MLKWCSCSEEKEQPATSSQPMRQPTMNSDAARTSAQPPSSSKDSQPHLHLAAIDNSLSFPHQHPGGWRSYTVRARIAN